MRKMQYHTTLAVTLADGREIDAPVYKSGRSIELHFSFPGSMSSMLILVHPMNQASVEGWCRELKVTTNLPIKECGLKMPSL